MSFKCCHNCLLRRPGCHDTCESYRKEKDEYEARKHIFRQKHPVEPVNYCFDKIGKVYHRKKNRR